MNRKLLFAALLLLPIAVSARVYNTAHLPYSDDPPDRPTAVAVSVLTNEEILRGNDDGTFLYRNLLNRAEFMEIAMRLLPPDGTPFDLSCFLDVAEEWFAEAVCRAKALGIVRGNERPGVPPEQWLFEPTRTVQYAEAVKVLGEIFSHSLPNVGGEWFEAYFAAGEERNTLLPERVRPDYLLRRGDMARLVARYLAEADGELELLLAAEVEDTSSTLSVTEEEEVPAEEDQNELEEEELNELEEELEPEIEDPLPPPPPVTFDPDPDTAVSQNFLLLGAVSPIMGGAEIFSEAQPIAIEEIVVQLTTSVTSIEAFLIFDENRALIGKAFLNPKDNTGREYMLSLKDGQLTLNKQEEFSFYARAVVKGFDSGGTSGQVATIDKMGIRGYGVWNTNNQSEFTSETYSSFQTARSTITDITNGGPNISALIGGSSQKIGSFRFTGLTGTADGSAKLEITDLDITMGTSGGVTVTNVELGADGTTQRHGCGVAGSTITCATIPDTLGTFEDAPRVLSIYANVDIPSNALDAKIRLQLNDPGSPVSAGAVRWTDGSANFIWVPLSWPVASSTEYSL